MAEFRLELTGHQVDDNDLAMMLRRLAGTFADEGVAREGTFEFEGLQITGSYTWQP